MTTKTSSKKAEIKAKGPKAKTPKVETPKVAAPEKKAESLFDMIRQVFAKGYTTSADVEKALANRKVKPAQATIRTQVSKLRKEAGLSADHSKGPVAKIRQHFANGATTVDAVCEKLDKDGVTYAKATVRTQVGKLRREAGLTQKTAA